MSSASQSSDGEDWEPRGSAIGAWDRRATSLPLLLLGGATAVGVAPQMWSSGPDFLTFYGLAWLTIPVAFTAIWLLFRRPAALAGAGRGAGSGVSVAVGLFLLLLPLVSATFMTMWLTGPYLIFGVGLLVVARWLRSAFLAVWAVVIGGIGVFEGFFGITNRLPWALWAAWLHPAIFLALALLTVLAGIAAWRRENRAT